MNESRILFLDEDDSKEQEQGAEGGQQSGGQNKLEEVIKVKIFKVYYTLLKDFTLSPWKLVVVLLIEFLQFLSFSFHPSVTPKEANNFIVEGQVGQRRRFEVYLRFASSHKHLVLDTGGRGHLE